VLKLVILCSSDRLDHLEKGLSCKIVENLNQIPKRLNSM